MKKIPTLYQRNPDDMRHVLPTLTRGCEWVLAGEGVATRKFDGTCVMLDDNGYWWARREVRPGKRAPENFLPIETDETTGKTVGWEPIAQSPFAKFHAEAVADAVFHPGTYELCGPKVQGNPEGFETHVLVRHGSVPLSHVDPDFETLRGYLEACSYEGIVWHHLDGRMAKIKKRDFS